ncbi:hypothetical protein KW443_02245, partial [Vibrio fluvialis]|nr:hypothetical protein [Vibrio fluvialis]
RQFKSKRIISLGSFTRCFHDTLQFHVGNVSTLFRTVQVNQKERNRALFFGFFGGVTTGFVFQYMLVFNNKS